MNRRKKIKNILTKRSKQANLKANPKKSKPKYISKAERAKMEAEAAANQSLESDKAVIEESESETSQS